VDGNDEAFLVTIHTTETINPDLDLYPILDTLGADFVTGLIWGVEHIDCTGPEAQDLCNAVVASPKRRILMSGNHLLQIAPKFMQVIEGYFAGYSSERDATDFLESDWYSVPFAESRAQIAIRVQDGSWFEVYLRDKALGERLARSFKGVQWEDPANYLT
jgi:hypothetical protein